jgi:hypothetical protein
VLVGYGKFSAADAPSFTFSSQPAQLPMKSTCYSGLIYTDNLDVALDCLTVDGNSDYVCVLPRTGAINCKANVPIAQMSKKKSVVYSVGKQTFLMSASLSLYIQN